MIRFAIYNHTNWSKTFFTYMCEKEIIQYDTFTYQRCEEHDYYGGSNHCSISWIQGNPRVCELQAKRETVQHITFPLTIDSVL